MNATPSPPRLHWSPVAPSWIVSGALVVLAVLPHQVPRAGRRFLRHPVGTLLFAALSAFVAWKKPVLGMALFIFLAGIVISGNQTNEPFAVKINNDRVKKPHRWFEEEIMSEEPHGIQERTENPVLNYDEVSESESEPWYGERVLDERPQAIQEKPVSAPNEYDEGGSSYGLR